MRKSHKCFFYPCTFLEPVMLPQQFGDIFQAQNSLFPALPQPISGIKNLLATCHSFKMCSCSFLDEWCAALTASNKLCLPLLFVKSTRKGEMRAEKTQTQPGQEERQFQELTSMDSASPARVCFQAVANSCSWGTALECLTTAKAWVIEKWDSLQSQVSFSWSTI